MWVLQETGTTRWNPEVSLIILLTMHLLSQPAVYSKMGHQNAESVLATAGLTSRLVELIVVDA